MDIISNIPDGQAALKKKRAAKQKALIKYSPIEEKGWENVPKVLAIVVKQALFPDGIGSISKSFMFSSKDKPSRTIVEETMYKCKHVAEAKKQLKCALSSSLQKNKKEGFDTATKDLKLAGVKSEILTGGNIFTFRKNTCYTVFPTIWFRCRFIKY